MRYTTISQLGTFTKFTPADGDHLSIDPARCSGGADAPQRPSVEPAPGLDGVLILPPLDDAQIITLAGTLVTEDNGDALDTLLGSLRTALNLLKAGPGDLVHSTGTLSVWKYGQLDTDWDGLTFMSVTFSVIVDVFA